MIQHKLWQVNIENLTHQADFLLNFQITQILVVINLKKIRIHTFYLKLTFSKFYDLAKKVLDEDVYQRSIEDITGHEYTEVIVLIKLKKDEKIKKIKKSIYLPLLLCRKLHFVQLIQKIQTV